VSWLALTVQSWKVGPDHLAKDAPIGIEAKDEKYSVLEMLTEIEEVRKNRAGDTFSMPDTTLYAFILFADQLNFPVATDFKALAGWRARVEELPRRSSPRISPV